MTTWTGTWVGGRIATRDGDEIYFIEKSIGPRGARKRLTHSLGPVGLEEAKVQLAAFNRDPFNYVTPQQEKRQEHARAERKQQTRQSSAVVLDEGLMAEFANAMRKGYGRRPPASATHRRSVHYYLSRWATSPVLYNRDLREVETLELRKYLDTFEHGVKHLIVSLRSMTAWLRWRGDLKPTEDPTVALSVPASRKTSPDEKVGKVYDVRLLEKTYARIESQDVRDVFRIRVSTGLHVSEIQRIAEGKCVIKAADRI